MSRSPCSGVISHRFSCLWSSNTERQMLRVPPLFLNLPLTKTCIFWCAPGLWNDGSLGWECLLLRLCDPLFDFSLQTWRTHIGPMSSSPVEMSKRKPEGINTPFEGVMMASFLWLQSECLSFLQFATRTFCHFTVQWKISHSTQKLLIGAPRPLRRLLCAW